MAIRKTGVLYRTRPSDVGWIGLIPGPMPQDFGAGSNRATMRAPSHHIEIGDAPSDGSSQPEHGLGTKINPTGTAVSVAFAEQRLKT